MTTPITIIVRGIPKPGGSKKGFPIRRAGGRVGVAIVDACDNKNWRTAVSLAGSLKMGSKEPLACPLGVYVVFHMPRPKSHYRKDGTLKPDAPNRHVTKPDATKLWRCAEDALTRIVWRDDSQIADEHILKRYGDLPGVSITVEELKP